MFHRRRQFVWLLLAALSAALGGCSLLKTSVGLFGEPTAAVGGKSRALPGIPTSRDAMQLEVLFVERPVGDSLLGDELWNEVDQVGSLEPQTRLALSRNGFRIGHTGSEPPLALERMLELKSEHASDGEPQEKLVGRRIVLASGSETEVQAGSLFPDCRVDIATADGTESKEFNNARFVFRLKAVRDQDGWARIEFLPEIHHGAHRLRHISGDAGFELRTSQDVYPLYSQRFAMLLNVGEMAIVSTDNERSASVARHFFLGSGENENVQRLLVVRLSDMTKTDPVYAE